MSRARSMQWLSDRLKTGLADLPENASWLVARVRAARENSGPRDGRPVDGARETGMDTPMTHPDAVRVAESVESRMRRARAAADEARRTEEEAIAASASAKEQSEHARGVVQAGTTRLAQTKREADQTVKDRETEARRAAEEAVAGDVKAARAAADARVQAVESEVNEETETVREEAQRAQERAQELVAEAARQLHEARRLAQEAREAAVAAAEEAQQAAQQLQADANEQLKDAEARVTEAERVGHQTNVTAKRTARDLQSDKLDFNLDSQPKTELLNLAASMDIDGRRTMSKAELVTAITKTSRANG